jgi:hypothetical protein
LKKRPQNNIGGFCSVECEICGPYCLDLFERLDAIPDSQRATLSAIVRRHYEFTRHWKTIVPADLDELASQAPDTNDVPSKVRYLLGYVAHKSKFPGQRVILVGKTDYPICFAASLEEFRFYAQYIIDAGFVDGQELSPDNRFTFRLTPRGWEEVARIPTLDSPFAFVAMSFSKDGNYGDLLRRAFDEAIKPAIEDDAGYKEAVRVDRKDFLGDIVYEIVARIKESRFVVADVTEQKNGVYFEAGFAMGMGLPVIWMCHNGDIKNAHFDTRNLSHIEWDDPIELRKSLANRILATIGRGPNRRR